MMDISGISSKWGRIELRRGVFRQTPFRLRDGQAVASTCCSAWSSPCKNRGKAEMMDEEQRDPFENPEHEDAFLAEREISYVLDGAGPEAVAAMPGVVRVRRVWKERSDGKKRRVEIDVCFQQNGQTAWFSFPGGKWCEGRIGFDREHLGPELFGDHCFLDEQGRCWGTIEEDVRPDPKKLAAFRAPRSGLNPNAKATAHDARRVTVMGVVFGFLKRSLPWLFGNMAIAVWTAAASPAGGGVLTPGEAFQDVKLLPSGIDDTYHGCWTWPRRLDEEVAACPPTSGEGAMPWFDMPYRDEETAISLHWIWAARRMYASVRSDSEGALRALAEWDAAKTPPLLLFCVRRRVGDMSWHPIVFALSRDGRWMLCPDEPSIWPDGGDWNGWRLLSIPEWRRIRIQRLYFELPDQKSVLDQYRKWSASAAYSPFANGLAEAERIAAKGYDIAFASREALAPGTFGLDYLDSGNGLFATNAAQVRTVLDAALVRLGPPSVRRTFESNGKWIHSWAWTKDGAALVAWFEREASPPEKPVRAMAFSGPIEKMGEKGEAAIGTQWDPREDRQYKRIVYRFSDAPTPVRRNVEIKSSRTFGPPPPPTR